MKIKTNIILTIVFCISSIFAAEARSRFRLLRGDNLDIEQ